MALPFRLKQWAARTIMFLLPSMAVGMRELVL
jgi:hypothetical protein